MGEMNGQVSVSLLMYLSGVSRALCLLVPPAPVLSTPRCSGACLISACMTCRAVGCAEGARVRVWGAWQRGGAKKAWRRGLGLFFRKELKGHGAKAGAGAGGGGRGRGEPTV